MSTILSDAGTIVTEALGWVSEVVSTVAGAPLLLLFIILPLVGLGIGLFRRIINIH